MRGWWRRAARHWSGERGSGRAGSAAGRTPATTTTTEPARASRASRALAAGRAAIDAGAGAGGGDGSICARRRRGGPRPDLARLSLRRGAGEARVVALAAKLELRAALRPLLSRGRQRVRRSRLGGAPVRADFHL